MALDKVQIGSVQVSRLAIGGNPFSGFCHQGEKRDAEMRKYYTVARIKEALRKAEAAGINTFFGRTDNHVIRMLQEYWDEGGKIQWFAQTASEIEDYNRSIKAAAANGAKGCYLHGGQVDYYWHRKETERFGQALEADAGRSAWPPASPRTTPSRTSGSATTSTPTSSLPATTTPVPRNDSPHHVVTDHEKFDPAHRDRMARTICTLKASAVHYKVLAAGRTPAEEAFQYVAKVIRPKDVVLVGFHLGDDPSLIGKTVSLFEKIVQPAVRGK